MFKEENNKLRAEFQFKDFKQAFAFMTEVALYAEQQNHHPNWVNLWNKVMIELCTHDAGNIVTDKDRKLANSIMEVYAKYNQKT